MAKLFIAIETDGGVLLKCLYGIGLARCNTLVCSMELADPDDLRSAPGIFELYRRLSGRR